MPESEAEAQAPLTKRQQEKVYKPEQKWSDSFALKVAIQDFNAAERFRTINHDWRWRAHFRLYEAWTEQKFWEGTRVPRSSVPIYLAFEQVEAMLPQIMSGIFADNPWFQADPEPGGSAAEARAVQGRILAQMERTHAENMIGAWVKSGLIFGDGILELSWLQKETTEQRFTGRWEAVPGVTGVGGFRRVLEMKDYTELDNRPVLKNRLLTEHYIDPNCQTLNPQDARYNITRTLPTVDEIVALRANDEYSVPDDGTLVQMSRDKSSTQGTITEAVGGEGSYSPNVDQTVDPGGKRVELIRYWTNDRLVDILNRRHILYNHPNPYGFQPFYHFPYASIPGRFYCLGMCDILDGEQRLQESIINARIDELAINLHRPLIKRRGISIPTYMLRNRPGQVLEADNPRDDFVFPPTPEMNTGAYIETNASQGRAEKVVGQSSTVSSGTPAAGGNSANRTAAGIAVQAQAGANRVQRLVKVGESLGLEPMLRDVLRLNKIFPPVGEESPDVNAELLINTSVKFFMRASAKMQSRASLMQTLPLIMQTMMNPALLSELAIQGQTVSFGELMHMVLDMTGYKNRGDLIRPLTEQEQQRMNQPPQEETIRMQMQKDRIASQEKITGAKIEAENQRAEDKEDGNVARAVLPAALKLVSDDTIEG